jgi:adenosylcobinamide-phosphate synthase
MIVGLAVLCAVILDTWFDKPRRWRPEAGFGRLALPLRRALDRPGAGRAGSRLRGAAALLAVVALSGPAWLLPLVLAATPARFGVDVAVLFLALGGHRLIHGARSRSQLHTTPSFSGAGPLGLLCGLLEDAGGEVYAVLFWYLLAGAGGVVVYRVVHAAARLWGGDPAAHQGFGRAAVGLDAAALWAPRHLAAVTYRLLGRFDPQRETGRARFGAAGDEDCGGGRLAKAGLDALGIDSTKGAEELEGGARGSQLACELDAIDVQRGIALVEQTLWLWTQAIVILGAVSWFIGNG